MQLCDSVDVGDDGATNLNEVAPRQHPLQRMHSVRDDISQPLDVQLRMITGRLDAVDGPDIERDQPTTHQDTDSRGTRRLQGVHLEPANRREGGASGL